MGEAAELLGLSYEIGAFIAGVSLASSPISQFIALNLRPLRDFFLILFFFTLGAQLNLGVLYTIIIPVIFMTANAIIMITPTTTIIIALAANTIATIAILIITHPD